MSRLNSNRQNVAHKHKNLNDALGLCSYVLLWTASCFSPPRPVSYGNESSRNTLYREIMETGLHVAAVSSSAVKLEQCVTSIDVLIRDDS